MLLVKMPLTSDKATWRGETGTIRMCKMSIKRINSVRQQNNTTDSMCNRTFRAIAQVRR